VKIAMLPRGYCDKPFYDGACLVSKRIAWPRTYHGLIRCERMTKCTKKPCLSRKILVASSRAPKEAQFLDPHSPETCRMLSDKLRDMT
jgi:hypothetical protein